MYHLRIKIGNKSYEELVFNDAEKEIFKLEKSLSGSKSVSINEDNKKYIFNTFEKQIKNHRDLVSEIFKSNSDYKSENSINNRDKKLKHEKESLETLKTPSVSSRQESKLEDDSYRKSDF